MELITKLWFAEGRIYILTDKGNTYSRPLEAFPLLLEATPEQRQRFVIGLDGEDIRWEEIDEDIHISSFYNTEEPNPDNVIADVFRRFPQLNVSEVARYIGINKSLLSRYIYGIKKPSQQRADQILEAIRQLGREMSKIWYYCALSCSRARHNWSGQEVPLPPQSMPLRRSITSSIFWPATRRLIPCRSQECYLLDDVVVIGHYVYQ